MVATGVEINADMIIPTPNLHARMIAHHSLTHSLEHEFDAFSIYL